MLRGPTSTARTASVAVAGAAAVVAAQIGVLVVSLGLFSRAVDDALPKSVVWAPLLAFSFGLVWLAVVFRRDSSTRLEWLGPLLVAAAPFTAFGGSCGHVDAASGIGLRRSGVRIAVESWGCATYVNGAVLVLGATLLAVGLWVSLEGR